VVGGRTSGPLHSGPALARRLGHLSGQRGAEVTNPLWEICECVAEVQALPDDHLECNRHSAPDVIAKAQAVMKVSPGAVRERGCSGQSDTRCQGSAQR
jgi:hypothetical protein